MSSTTRSDESSDKDKPKTLGSGFVTSTLGEGGAAVVYEIWNPKLEIHRAVKLWRPNLSEKDLQRFETEIKITSKLDHPNIVEIHTVGEWNGLPYIEMERIDGFSLHQVLKTNGPLPPAVALAVTILVCRALNYAHQEEFNLYGRKRKGVIHCDIKPANIMITRSGMVKLMDFGIANPTNVSLHTDPDKVTGSLQYMAPEQIKSRKVDARTDIFAIGVVLYEMLAGTKAFPSKQLLEVIEKRKTNEHVPLSQLCTSLPKPLYRMVESCMELLPEKRYQNVAELLKSLIDVYRKFSNDDPQKAIKDFLETGAVPTRKIKITRHMTTTVAAAVVPTVLLLIVVAIFVMGPRGKTTVSPQTTDSAAQILNVVTPEVPPAEQLLPPAATQTAPLDSATPDTVAQPEAPTAEEPQVRVQPAKPKRSVPPPAPADPLSALEKMVDNGNIAGALKKFETREPINDGAYFALYARCLYETGAWKKACDMAEKSTRVPSTRIPERARTGQYLLYKAKSLSAQYDAAPSQESARAAIGVWWKVREHFEGTSESAKAAFADSEIGRLGKILE